MKGQRKQTLLLRVASLIMLFSLVAGTWSIAYGAETALGVLPAQNNAVIPTIAILSVKVDESVTIRTANYPANDTFNVLMNYMGTRGVGGYLVTTFNSGAGGSIEATFAIPAQLKGQQQIAIRLESPTSGYFSYNWFYNNSTGGIPPTGPTVTPGPSPTARPPFRTPTFVISGVSRDVSVSVQTANFPANDTFNVYMNYMGTRGVGGTQVGTLATGAGGTLTGTYNIPAFLKGQYQIAIRFESPSSGYYSFNWFYNNTTGGIPPTGPTVTPGPSPTARPPFRVPTFVITSVTRDVSASVRTTDFPANDTFNVYMNYMGTRGVGGTQVGTLATGAGGTLDATYNIPDYLKGQYQIAIRFESPSSGYYSFNWFYNNTAGGIPPTGPTVTPGPSPTPGPTRTPFVVPTISITGVARDVSVTIQTANYPPNDTFNVYMNYMGTRGVGGILVGTWNSGAGGAQTATFNIPAAMKGQSQIAIRLESPTSGLFSYNWFYNNNAP